MYSSARVAHYFQKRSCVNKGIGVLNTKEYAYVDEGQSRFNSNSKEIVRHEDRLGESTRYDSGRLSGKSMHGLSK